MKNIADIREDYLLAQLDEASVGNNPIDFFSTWFTEAQKAEITEVNAMTLSTVDSENRAHGRIVLLKGVEDNKFIFYTNYNSNKGLEISNNPNVSLIFFWKELQRQVRIEGIASKVHPDVSNEYFTTRPEASRLGAWASPQSQIIDNRNVLDANYQKYKAQFTNQSIERPEHWGGYAVEPENIEFWQGRASRMHDRILFSKSENDLWKKYRLAP